METQVVPVVVVNYYIGCFISTLISSITGTTFTSKYNST